MSDGPPTAGVSERPAADSAQQPLDETPASAIVSDTASADVVPPEPGDHLGGSQTATPGTADRQGRQMIEKTCNLWSERADFRCIPTTGATASDGSAVMDQGIALEAAQRYRGLEIDLGRLLTSRGNHVHQLRAGLLSFPIQQYVWSGPSLQVIRQSAEELCAIVGDALTLLPCPVDGKSSLTREQVTEALASLPDNIVLIQHTP